MSQEWYGYYKEAEAYYKTVIGLQKKGNRLGGIVTYNLIGRALEGFLTAVMMHDDKLPEQSSISSMLRELAKTCEVPTYFKEEARFYNRFMNYCSLEVLPQLVPTDDEINRMVVYLHDLRLWVAESLKQDLQSI